MNRSHQKVNQPMVSLEYREWHHLDHLQIALYFELWWYVITEHQTLFIAAQFLLCQNPKCDMLHLFLTFPFPINQSTPSLGLKFPNKRGVKGSCWMIVYVRQASSEICSAAPRLETVQNNPSGSIVNCLMKKYYPHIWLWATEAAEWLCMLGKLQMKYVPQMETVQYILSSSGIDFNTVVRGLGFKWNMFRGWILSKTCIPGWAALHNGASTYEIWK